MSKRTDWLSILVLQTAGLALSGCHLAYGDFSEQGDPTPPPPGSSVIWCEVGRHECTTQGSLVDCSFKFGLNVNPTNRSWILDNLRFTP